MRRGRNEERDDDEGPVLTPVLHFCDDAQRTAFVTAMAISVVSDETLGAQGLSDLPGERDIHMIVYKLDDEKNVVTVTQLPNMGKAKSLTCFFLYLIPKTRGTPSASLSFSSCIGLHESMNLYSHMLHGQGLKVPHPMVADYHEYLGRYLRMEISNEDAFMAQIYPAPPSRRFAAPETFRAALGPHEYLGGEYLDAGEQERPQRRRRIHEEEEGPLPFPMPPPMNMIRAVLEGFGITIREVDLSAPGRVDEKPEPEEVKPLEEAWEQLLSKPERIAGVPECNMCCDYSGTIALVPCGHRLCCDDCFRKMMTTSTLVKVCPKCREDFKTIVKVRD
jgi:hypothetical protein